MITRSQAGKLDAESMEREIRNVEKILDSILSQPPNCGSYWSVSFKNLQYNVANAVVEMYRSKGGWTIELVDNQMDDLYMNFR